MAYGLKYYAHWRTPNGARYGLLNILEKDYTGESSLIALQNDAISIIQEYTDLETPLLGLRCEFSVLNDRADYFELFELLTATERKFQVTVGEAVSGPPYGYTLFAGFLNVDVISHGYLHKQEMRLIASSYLSKLDYLHPSIIDEKQNVTFIDLIDNILTEAGIGYDIRVNCKLYPTGDLVSLPSGKTLFNLTGINTEAFWNSDVEKKTSQEILEAILTPFHCFMYWFDDHWYIEQFSDIWGASASYIQYTTGVSYSPTSTGSSISVSRSIEDVSEIQFRHTSQEVQIVPGNRLISVKMNSSSSLILNMLIPLPLLANGPIAPYPITVTSSDIFVYNIVVQKSSTTYFIYLVGIQDVLKARQWAILYNPSYPITMTEFGMSQYGIGNAFKRSLNYAIRYLPAYLMTSFETTVSEETEITFEFTYAEIAGFIRTTLVTHPEGAYNCQIDFKFAIGFYGTVDATTGWFWIKEDPNEAGRWIVSTVLGEDMVDISYTSITVTGNSFELDNSNIPKATINTSIPLGTVENSSGTDTNYLITLGIKKFYLVLGGERVWASSDTAMNCAPTCVFGDFKITTSNDLEDDLIEGSINTDFLNKKEVEFYIGDNENLNYTNGILRGDDLSIRTNEWNRPTLAAPDKLINIFFMEKFRMYNATKQILVGSATYTGRRTFSLFTESKQNNKKFVYFGYSLTPRNNEVEMTLLEYDNESDVTIIEE